MAYTCPVKMADKISSKLSQIKPWITYSPDQIRDTPSRYDGIPERDERDYRASCVFFLESLCKHERLKCTYLAQTCASVYFHRFYQHQSFKKHDRFVVAVACLFLACKVEEESRRISDVVTAYFHIKNILKKSEIKVTDEQKSTMLNKVLITERIVLQTLAFELKQTNPVDWFIEKFNIIKKYIREEKRKDVKLNATKFLRDCYRSTIPIQHIQKDIALSTLFLATLELGEEPIVLPSNKMEVTWLDLFEVDTTEEILNDVCNMIIDVYESGVNVKLDMNMAKSLRQRLKDSKKVGPSPNCVATSPSVQSANNSSPSWPSQDVDDSYLYEGEERKKTYNVTVSKVQRSGDGSLKVPAHSHSALTPPVHQPPPPPLPPPHPPSSASEQATSTSPFHAPSPSMRPPPPPVHEYTESPAYEGAQVREETDRKKMRIE